MDLLKFGDWASGDEAQEYLEWQERYENEYLRKASELEHGIMKQLDEFWQSYIEGGGTYAELHNLFSKLYDGFSTIYRKKSEDQLYWQYFLHPEEMLEALEALKNSTKH